MWNSYIPWWNSQGRVVSHAESFEGLDFGNPSWFSGITDGQRSMYAEEVALTLQALARYELGNPTAGRLGGSEEVVLY